MNKEIRMLEGIWDILNLKKDPFGLETIELEFLIQLLKIIFDPYTPLDS